ncbi:MAG: hypothetical protein ACYSPI_14115 [Planctomycetota bacterium]
MTGEFNIGDEKSEVVFRSNNNTDTQITDTQVGEPEAHFQSIFWQLPIEIIHHDDDLIQRPADEHSNQQPKENPGQSKQ